MLWLIEQADDVVHLQAKVDVESSLKADRDSWELQASDRTSDAISAMRRAELAEARVAELEAQDHVGVYTCQQRRDSFPVFVPGIMLNRWIPTGTKLYAAPVLPAQAVPDGVTRVTRSFRHDHDDIVTPTAILSFRQGDHKDDATWEERDRFVDAMQSALAASKAAGGE